MIYAATLAWVVVQILFWFCARYGGYQRALSALERRQFMVSELIKKNPDNEFYRTTSIETYMCTKLLQLGGSHVKLDEHVAKLLKDS